MLSYGRLVTRECGQAREEFVYNAKDKNLHSRSRCNGQTTKYLYENNELVSLGIANSRQQDPCRLIKFYPNFLTQYIVLLYKLVSILLVVKFLK